MSSSPEDQGAGWEAAPRDDQPDTRIRDLNRRFSSDLSRRFYNVIHGLDVGLPQVTPVGIDRQFAADGNTRRPADEVRTLATTAEPQSFKRHEDR